MFNEKNKSQYIKSLNSVPSPSEFAATAKYP